MTSTRSRRSSVVIAAIILTLVLGGARWYRWINRACCVYPAHDLLALQPMPNDFAIEMVSGTGTVAPPYHFSYSVRSEHDGRAELRYWPGNDRLDSMMLRDTFHVAAPALDTLADRALRMRRAPGGVPSSQQPVGGSSPRLTIVAEGTTTVVEPYQPWNEQVQHVEESIRAASPPSVWARCEEIQRKFASSLGKGTSQSSGRH
jgi:hypothetical protein